MSAHSALARRAWRDGRTRTLAFAYLFAAYAYVQPVGYRHAYPTAASREAFAHSFAGNDALRLFYGYPYDPLTVGGYSAWRVGGVLAIAAAVYGVLAAVRALRAEEEAGRTEVVLAGRLGRGAAFGCAMAALAAGAAVVGFAEYAGFLAGGLPAGGAAYLALASTSVVPVFVGVGALTSQLAPTRRLALEWGIAVVVVSLVVRVAADTSAGAEWLRWATPLGWAEELRPFTGTRPAVLLIPAAVSVAACALAAWLSARRDLGTGLIAARDTAEPRMGLLGTPLAQAARSERASLVAWVGGVGAFAVVLGVVSASVSSAGISRSLREQFARLGTGSIATPTGYLAFVFVVFILALSLFACAQIAAARREESEQRLETLLALPVGRRRWLVGRLALAAGGIAACAAAAGVLTWAGAASQGVGVSLSSMLEAAGNCLPVALLFLGVAALVYGLAPRASTGLAYGVVSVAFVWQLVGALLGAPRWLLDATPFAHVGYVPSQPFRAGAAVAMLALAGAAGAAAVWAFGRRDLTEA